MQILSVIKLSLYLPKGSGFLRHSSLLYLIPELTALILVKESWQQYTLVLKISDYNVKDILYGCLAEVDILLGLT